MPLNPSAISWCAFYDDGVEKFASPRVLPLALHRCYWQPSQTHFERGRGKTFNRLWRSQTKEEVSFITINILGPCVRKVCAVQANYHSLWHLNMSHRMNVWPHVDLIRLYCWNERAEERNEKYTRNRKTTLFTFSYSITKLHSILYSLSFQLLLHFYQKLMIIERRLYCTAITEP